MGYERQHAPEKRRGARDLSDPLLDDEVAGEEEERARPLPGKRSRTEQFWQASPVRPPRPGKQPLAMGLPQGRVAARRPAPGFASRRRREREERRDPLSPASLLSRALARSGRELPRDLRARLERAFGVSLGRVRLHDDAAAIEAARAIGARAVTVGTDILFDRGEFRPGTAEGDETIAHEIAHAVQNLEGRSAAATAAEADVPVTRPGDSAEREAERAGRQFAAGRLGAEGASNAEAVARGAAATGLPAGAPARAATSTSPADTSSAGDPRAENLASAGAASSGDTSASETPVAARRTGAGAGHRGRPRHRHGPRQGRARGPKEQGSAGTTHASPPPGHHESLGSGSGSGRGSSSGGGSAPHVGGGGSSDLSGNTLHQAATQANQSVKNEGSALKSESQVDANPNKNTEQNHAKKVERYRNGVNGIAKVIEGLDAFGDLEDACSWHGSDSDKGPALARIRASRPFKQLVKMRQGALDGGADRPVMERIFNDEFHSRGWLGHTHEAFNLVHNEAVRLAKSDEARKRKAQAAREKAEKQKQKRANAKGGKGGAHGHGAHGGGGAAAAAKLSAAALESVTANPAHIPAFDQMMSEAPDKGGVDKMLVLVKHHEGLVEAVGKGPKQSRSQLIGNELEKGIKPFAKGFGKAGLMGLAGHYGDKLAGKAAKRAAEAYTGKIAKRLAKRMAEKEAEKLAEKKVDRFSGRALPMVGPVLALVTNNPVKSYHELVGGVEKGFHSFGAAEHDYALLKGMHGTKDEIGVFCVLLADLFDGIADILNAISQALGTISAICLILGAVLMAVGLALCWLPIGDALLSFGELLLDWGESLGRISDVISKVGLGATALGLIFRIAGAFLVPSEMLGTQLNKTGKDTVGFSNAAGQRLGMHGSRTAAKSLDPRLGMAEAKPGAGPGEEPKNKGAADGQRLNDGVKAQNEALQHDADEAKAKSAAAKAAADAAKSKQQETRAKTQAAGKQAHPNEPEARRPAQVDEPKSRGAKNQGRPDEGSPERKPAQPKSDKPGEEDKAKSKKPGKAAKIGKAALRLGKEMAVDFGRRVWEDVRINKAVIRNTRRLAADVADLVRASRHPLHMDGDAQIGAHLDDIKSHLEASGKKIEELGKRAAEQDTIFNENLHKLMSGEVALDPEAEAQVHKAMTEAAQSWQKAHDELTQLQDGFKKALDRANAGSQQKGVPTEDMDGDAYEDTDGTKESIEERLREVEDRPKKLRKAQNKQPELEENLRSRQKELQAAEKQEQAAKHKLDELEDDPRKHVAEQVDRHNANLERAKALEVRAKQVKSAYENRLRAQHLLDSLKGKTVTVHGQACKIVSVEGDSVMLDGPFDVARLESVKGEDLPEGWREAPSRLAKANVDLTRAAGGDNASDPARLESELRGRAMKIELAEERKGTRAQWAHRQAQSQQWKGERNQAGGAADSAERRLTQARDSVKTAGDELDKNKQDQAKLERQIAQDKANQTARALRRAHAAHMRKEHEEDHFGEILGRIAYAILMSNHVTKAVGKWLAWLLNPEANADKEEHEDEEQRGEDENRWKQEDEGKFTYGHGEGAGDKGADKVKQSAVGGDKGRGDKGGGHPQEGAGEHESPLDRDVQKIVKDADGRVSALAARRNLIEGLITPFPPVDADELSKHRENAAKAYKTYHDQHVQAYKCYVAEQAVSELARHTGQLAEEGRPLHGHVQQIAPHIQKGKQDEQRRGQKLGEAKPDAVKPSHSTMAHLVMKLIGGIASHGDHLSQKPKVGADPHAMAGAQDNAHKHAHKQTAQSKGASQGQSQILDQAESLQAQQAASIEGNMKALRGKQVDQLEVRDMIRQRKAQAIVARDEAGKRCADEAGKFNAGYPKLKAWSDHYEQKRKTIMDGHGGK